MEIDLDKLSMKLSQLQSKIKYMTKQIQKHRDGEASSRLEEALAAKIGQLDRDKPEDSRIKKERAVEKLLKTLVRDHMKIYEEFSEEEDLADMRKILEQEFPWLGLSDESNPEEDYEVDEDEGWLF